MVKSSFDPTISQGMPTRKIKLKIFNMNEELMPLYEEWLTYKNNFEL